MLNSTGSNQCMSAKSLLVSSGSSLLLQPEGSFNAALSPGITVGSCRFKVLRPDVALPQHGLHLVLVLLWPSRQAPALVLSTLLCTTEEDGKGRLSNLGGEVKAKVIVDKNSVL